MLIIFWHWKCLIQHRGRSAHAMPFRCALYKTGHAESLGLKTAIQTMIDYNFSMYTTANLDVLTPWPIVSSSNMPLAVGNLIPPHIE